MRALVLFIVPMALLWLLPGAAAAARLHYRPPEGFIGDIHPVFYQGRYYLPHLTANSSRTRLFVSGLLVSHDLLHWEELPISVEGVAAPEAGGADLARWRTTPVRPPLGGETARDTQVRQMITAMIDDTVPRFWLVTVMADPKSGRLFAFYPYNGIRMLTSTDMQSWWLYLLNPVLQGDNRFREFRDPSVFWNEDDERYWMVLTTSLHGTPKQSGGAISYARSEDLLHWQFEGPLYYPGNVSSPECPEMFKLGGRWYLLAGYTTIRGTVGATEYVLSDSANGPWSKPPISTLAGTDHIVGNTLFDGKKRYLFGWIPTYAGDEALRRPEWGGDLALPREVYAGPGGTLYTRLPVAYDGIRGQRLLSGTADDFTHEAGQVTVAGASITVAPGAYGRVGLRRSHRASSTGDRFDLELELTHAPQSRSAGVILSKGDRPGIEIGVDLHYQRLVVRRHGDPIGALAQQAVTVDPDEPMQLRVIIEEDIAEVFLADRFSLSARLPEMMNEHSLSIFVDGGGAVRNVQVFDLVDPSHAAIPPRRNGTR